MKTNVSTRDQHSFLKALGRDWFLCLLQLLVATHIPWLASLLCFTAISNRRPADTDHCCSCCSQCSQCSQCSPPPLETFLFTLHPPNSWRNSPCGPSVGRFSLTCSLDVCHRTLQGNLNMREREQIALIMSTCPCQLY